MYDPDGFRHGIEVLRGVEEGWGFGCRKDVLEIMLDDLAGLDGNAHHKLTSYVAGLSMFPDDPVDFAKLNELHYEYVCIWASSTDHLLSNERKRTDVLNPVAKKYLETKAKTQRGANRNAELAEKRKQAIHYWVDKYINQRSLTVVPSASELATRLLKSGSDFVWPDNCKPLSHDRVRKAISAHLTG